MDASSSVNLEESRAHERIVMTCVYYTPPETSEIPSSQKAHERIVMTCVYYTPPETSEIPSSQKACLQSSDSHVGNPHNSFDITRNNHILMYMLSWCKNAFAGCSSLSVLAEIQRANLGDLTMQPKAELLQMKLIPLVLLIDLPAGINNDRTIAHLLRRHEAKKFRIPLSQTILYINTSHTKAMITNSKALKFKVDQILNYVRVLACFLSCNLWIKSRTYSLIRSSTLLFSMTLKACVLLRSW